MISGTYLLNQLKQDLIDLKNDSKLNIGADILESAIQDLENNYYSDLDKFQHNVYSQLMTRLWQKKIPTYDIPKDVVTIRPFTVVTDDLDKEPSPYIPLNELPYSNNDRNDEKFNDYRDLEWERMNKGN